MDKRKPMNWIHITSGDFNGGVACFRVNSMAIVGYAGVAQPVRPRFSWEELSDLMLFCPHFSRECLGVWL